MGILLGNPGTYLNHVNGCVFVLLNNKHALWYIVIIYVQPRAGALIPSLLLFISLHQLGNQTIPRTKYVQHCGQWLVMLVIHCSFYIFWEGI